MAQGWYGIRPHKTPRSFPYVKNGAFQHWVATHGATVDWANLNANYLAPSGPDPGFFSQEKPTAYLWAILCLLATPDIGPLPRPGSGIRGLYHPPLPVT